MPLEVTDYKNVVKALGGGRAHLLLGNGFSIECDPIFKYPSLYEKALDAGLSPEAQKVFQSLGTNNFEGVMRALDTGHVIAKIYGLIDSDDSLMRNDLERIKLALIDAIATSHLDNIGNVPLEKRESACAFFKPYYNVFTTNYDLLAYWVVMTPSKGPVYKDCFAEDKESDTVVFSFPLGSQKGLLYLHGGLHLYVSSGQTTKHCWNREGAPLTNLVKAGMERGDYPLFVAEGQPDKKLQQIHNNAYLAYAFGKFSRIENPLVVFGQALGSSDEHLLRAIIEMRDLTDLYLSFHGGDTQQAEATIHTIDSMRHKIGLGPLTTTLFPSESAKVWG